MHLLFSTSCLMNAFIFSSFCLIEAFILSNFYLNLALSLSFSCLIENVLFLFWFHESFCFVYFESHSSLHFALFLFHWSFHFCLLVSFTLAFRHLFSLTMRLSSISCLDEAFILSFLPGSQTLFSLLTVTSFSPLSLHKLTLLVYNSATNHLIIIFNK